MSENHTAITATIPPDFVQTLNQVQATTNALNALTQVWVDVADDDSGPAVDNDGDLRKRHQRPHIDGGVVMALENSIVGVCNRIDKMMDDDLRWQRFDNVAPVKRFVAESNARVKLFRTQQRLVEHQAFAVQSAQLPHRVFVPKFTRLPDGWEARYAGTNFDLVGKGASAADAVDAFDSAFMQEVNDELGALEFAKISDEKQHTGTVGHQGGGIPPESPGGGPPEGGEGTGDECDPGAEVD